MESDLKNAFDDNQNLRILPNQVTCNYFKNRIDSSLNHCFLLTNYYFFSLIITNENHFKFNMSYLNRNFINL